MSSRLQSYETTSNKMSDEQICDIKMPSSKWITLNVGGKLFTTTISTLTEKEPSCMLARMFAPDSNIMPSDVDDHGGVYSYSFYRL